MDQLMLPTLVLLAVMGGSLVLGVWIGIALLAGAASAFIIAGPQTLGLLADSIWDSSWDWALTALPLFIWMGEILSRSKVANQMFSGLAPWFAKFPGGLLHINVFACGVMAAVTGSSAATAATVGSISIPELKRRRYSERMMIGSLAGSGTLGLLIPPSIVMIVYGVTAQVSVAKLFIAGIIPGIMIMLAFILFIVFWALRHRDQMPAAEERLPFIEKLKRSTQLTSVVILIVLVIGSIYGGYATPTEAAVVGVAGSLLLAAMNRALTWQVFADGLMASVKVSCMIALIIVSAAALSTGAGIVGIPQAIAQWVGAFGLSHYYFLFLLSVLIIIMGCFLDGVSIIVLTSSILLPMVRGYGIDMLWFGVYLTILIEVAQITPPVGFNLFVLQSLTGKSILTITRATLPFFLLLLFVLTILIAWPQFVTWLPQSSTI